MRVGISSLGGESNSSVKVGVTLLWKSWHSRATPRGLSDTPSPTSRVRMSTKLQYFSPHFNIRHMLAVPSPSHFYPDYAIRLCKGPSTRGITTRAVVIDEMARTTAQVVRTASRADDTPVNSDTTTNTFSGTRNREESCRPYA